ATPGARQALHQGLNPHPASLAAACAAHGPPPRNMAPKGWGSAATTPPQETHQVLRREKVGPVDLATMGDSAQMSWSDHGSVFLQRATQSWRCRRAPLGSPGCQLLVG